MEKYTKAYTRENTLFALQVWEEHQGHRLEQYFGENAPMSIFDVREGVASVYYHEQIFEIWQNLIAESTGSKPEIVEGLMTLYASQIDTLEEIWKKGVFDTKEDLIQFFGFMADTWVGLSISYNLPEIKSLSQEFQDLGMELRKRSVDFLDNTDRVILKTLRNLYPDLGEGVKFIAIEEIMSNNLPSKEILEARGNHYIYADFKIILNTEVHSVASQYGIQITEEVIPEDVREILGQVAMKGVAQGKVRVLHKKSEIKNLLQGEILVTAMTTPDYLPAMNKAGAFVTDEGGITCHAAIVAREMKKPCIIGTKIATQVLKDGDLVEVDAHSGVVTIVERLVK